MTKNWDDYKDTILALYEHQTLATVMEVMKRDYNFVASTRAYRQKLDKWGKRKYKKRKGKSDNSPEGSDAESFGEGAGSSSGPTSPVVSTRNHGSQRHQSTAAHTGHHGTTTTSTFNQRDVDYSLNQPGADVNNAYGTTQYQDTTSYDATYHTSWASNPHAATAYDYSQAPLDANMTAYSYDDTSFSATDDAAAYQYMDPSTGAYPMPNQMDFTGYQDGWDHAHNG
ncbi:hypothetical protein PG990_008341 [Apiospora arundinis]